MSLTRKEKARWRAIVSQLRELSRDGWKHAKPCDYEPLERELRALDLKANPPEQRPC